MHVKKGDKQNVNYTRPYTSRKVINVNYTRPARQGDKQNVNYTRPYTSRKVINKMSTIHDHARQER